MTGCSTPSFTAGALRAQDGRHGDVPRCRGRAERGGGEKLAAAERNFTGLTCALSLWLALRRWIRRLGFG